MQIMTTAALLRALYPEPRERAVKKQPGAIDGHARRFTRRYEPDL